MRIIGSVIEQIIKWVPCDFPNRKDLLSDLKIIQKCTLYMAPETTHDFWEKTSAILTRHLGEPDVYWKEKIAVIFADQETT